MTTEEDEVRLTRTRKDFNILEYQVIYEGVQNMEDIFYIQSFSPNSRSNNDYIRPIELIFVPKEDYEDNEYGVWQD